MTSPVRQWMDDHAIAYDVAKEVGLRADHAPNGGQRLIAPYERADGSTFNRIRIFPEGDWMQPRGESLACWWPLGRSYGANVLLTEGEGDCLAATTAIERSDDLAVCPVGLPGVAATTVCAAELSHARTKRAYICLDADDAGRRATDKLREVLPAVGVEPWVVRLEGHKDLSEYLVAGGSLTELLWTATHEPIVKPPREPTTPTKDVEDLKSIPAPHWISVLAEIEEPAPGSLIHCPLHDERTPSCRVNQNFYYCFGCGSTGDIFNFSMALWNVDFREAKERLEQIFERAVA